MAEKQRVQLTLWIAHKKTNALMKAFDMRPDYKVFVSGKQCVTFNTSEMVNSKYILNLIEKSKEQDDFWIPAIEHCGALYMSPEIMEISDGKHCYFAGREAA